MRFPVGLLLKLAAGHVCGGDHFVTQPNQIEGLAECTRVDTLSVILREPAAVELPKLEEVGDLAIMGEGVTIISLSKLRSAGRLSIFGTPNLTRCDVSSLQLAGAVGLVGTGRLEAVSFKAGLVYLGGLLVTETHLRRITGIQATKIDLLDVEGNPFLERIRLENLTAVANTMAFKANHADLAVDAPALTHIGGNIDVSGGSGVYLPGLKAIGGGLSLAALGSRGVTLPMTSVGTTLTIQDCPLLTSVVMQHLRNVGAGISVIGNHELINLNLESLQQVEGDLLVTSPKLAAFSLNPDFASRYAAEITAGIDCHKFVSYYANRFAALSCIAI